MAPMTARPLAAARALVPVALLLTGACVAPSGAPRSPIVTDRPDFTESAVTVPGGSFQVEAGATYEEAAGADATTVGEILLRAGLRERVELRIGLPSYAHESIPVPPQGRFDDDGFTDVVLGAKLALHSPAEGASRAVPTVGLIVGSSFPTGTGGLDAGGPQPEAKLLLAWSLTDRVSLSSNLNWAHVEERGDASYSEPSASLSLGLGLTETVGSYLEAFAFAPSYDDAPRPAYLNGGLTWQLNPDFQLDARVGVGVADAPDSHFVGIGLSRRFW